MASSSTQKPQSETSEAVKKIDVFMYSMTEAFLSEQIESIISDAILDKNLGQPLNHANLEKAIKAIQEFLVLCEGMPEAKNEGERQGRLCVRSKFFHSLAWCYGAIGDYRHEEFYFKLELAIYEDLVKFNPCYTLFCMPALNELASAYLDHHQSVDKARKCLDKIHSYHRDFLNNKQRIPEEVLNKIIQHPRGIQLKSRMEQGTQMAEYFYTHSLKLCSNYYYMKKNFRMAVKVGLRYLKRQGELHSDDMDQNNWANTSMKLALRCLVYRALPQAVYLMSATNQVATKLEAQVKAKSHDNCNHKDKSIHNKRRLIKKLRSEIDINILKIAIWTLEESYKRVEYNRKIAQNNDDVDEDELKKLCLESTLETFSFIEKEDYTNLLPSHLCTEQKDFVALLKKAKTLMKSTKKTLSTKPQSDEYQQIQTRLDKVAQMRI